MNLYDMTQAIHNKIINGNKFIFIAGYDDSNGQYIGSVYDEDTFSPLIWSSAHVKTIYTSDYLNISCETHTIIVTFKKDGVYTDKKLYRHDYKAGDTLSLGYSVDKTLACDYMPLMITVN